MKVLMFGWEFPPHISGGLGTACFGLTKGLAELKDVDVLFVVPKSFGDEDQAAIKLIGANNVPLSKKEMEFESIQEKIKYFEVNSGLIPYVSEEEFWDLKKAKFSLSGSQFVETDEGMKIKFSGEYGPNLLQEIKNYALVSDIIARENQFDLIHAHDWLAYPAGIAAKKAEEIILGIVQEMEVGKTYDAKVVRIEDYGAFVEIKKGVQGLVHISLIANERIDRVTDVLQMGQEIRVKLLEVDEKGRLRLSMKDAE